MIMMNDAVWCFLAFHAVSSTTCLQVVPRQAEGGSFKVKTTIAYRAEQRVCLSGSALPSKLKLENVKTKLSRKMWKRNFRVTLPSKLKLENVKTKLSHKNWKSNMCKQSFCVRLPSKPEGWRCENEAFVRHFPQKRKVEDVKSKHAVRSLGCETSLL